MNKVEKENISDKFVEKDTEDEVKDHDVSKPLPDSLIQYLSIDLSCHKVNRPLQRDRRK